jgi:hypothetical protein
LSILLCLIRRTLDDPARAKAYLDVVDKGWPKSRLTGASLNQVAQMECHEYTRLRHHYEAALRHWGHVLLSPVIVPTGATARLAGEIKQKAFDE